MTAPTDIPAPPLPTPPPPLKVLEDLPCQKCSYNLRTQLMAGVCPECGTPVETSLRGEALRGADPHWLLILNFGMKCVTVGYLFVWLLNYFYGRSSIFQLIALTFTVIIALGTWLLTAPEPSGIGEEKNASLRIWPRTFAILQFFSTLSGSFSIAALAGFYVELRGVQMITQFVWGVSLLWYLLRLSNRCDQQPIFAQNVFPYPLAKTLRSHIRGYLHWYILMWCIVFAAWIVQQFAHVSPRNLPREMIALLSLWAGFQLFRGLRLFARALAVEIAYSPNPLRASLWRSAGSFLYWFTQPFRRKNVQQSNQQR